MELSRELKEKVEKAATPEEAKKIIEEAGVKLTEAELDQVAGGCAENRILQHYTGNAADEGGVTAKYCKIAAEGKITAHFKSF